MWWVQVPNIGGYDSAVNERLMTDLFCCVRVSRTMKAATGRMLAVWSLLGMVETNLVG